LSGKQKQGEIHDALYFYWGYELHAVLNGRWKLHMPHPSKVVVEPGHGGERGRSGTSDRFNGHLTAGDHKRSVSGSSVISLKH